MFTSISYISISSSSVSTTFVLHTEYLKYAYFMMISVEQAISVMVMNTV